LNRNSPVGGGALRFIIVRHRVRAKRGPMTGSAKAIQNLSAAADWIASLCSQ
jgi:hypothetical protein